MEITYVYDQRYEVYRRIMKETNTMYKIANGDGEITELDKSNISNTITLNPYPVGTTVFSTKNKRMGTIIDINEHRYNELYAIDTPQVLFHSTHDNITPINY